MKIFDEVFQKNRSAALKNRDKKVKYLPTIKINENLIRYDNNQIDESEILYLNNENNIVSEESLLDAQYISDVFERDFRRYSNTFEIDFGGVKI